MLVLFSTMCMGAGSTPPCFIEPRSVAPSIPTTPVMFVGRASSAASSSRSFASPSKIDQRASDLLCARHVFAISFYSTGGPACSVEWFWRHARYDVNGLIKMMNYTGCATE